MIRMVFLLLIVAICYLVAFIMIFRVFLIALTFNSSSPFVPSSRKVVKKALEMFELKKGDRVIDIGSGDGRFLIYAAKRYPEVQFYGIELNKFLVWLSNMEKKLLKIKNVEFIHGDAEKHDLSCYNKIFFYMPQYFVAKILKSIEGKLSSGTTVISSTFGFGEEFTKTHEVKEYTFTDIGKRGRISLWNK